MSQFDVKMTRAFGGPSAFTFGIQPIAAFVGRWLPRCEEWLDPFAGKFSPAKHRNDLNPDSNAEYHLDAEEFLKRFEPGVYGLLFDPPYSPRQISEMYKGIGLAVGMTETQNGLLYARVRNAAVKILLPGSVVLSFGWNSTGMGKNRGFRIEEVMLVNHGAAHNDTICIAETLIPTMFD